MATSSQFEPVAQSKLDIFKKTKVQVTQVGYERITLSPHNAITPSSKRIQFRHPGKNTDYYRYMGHIYLDIDFSITTPTGAAVDESLEAGVINYWNQTCIDSIDIKLNDVYITRNTQNYPLRSIIEAYMTGNKLDADGRLAAAGFYMDGGDDVKADTTTNPGFKSRFELFKGGQPVCSVGKLHTDIGRTELFLPNGLDLDIVINLKNDDFILMSKATHAGIFNLKDASLHIEICHINPAVLTAHARVFQDHNAIIPFQHVEVRTENVPKGANTVSLDNIITGPLPTVIIVGLMDNQDLAGSRLTNSLCFKHYSLTELIFRVNGRPYLISPMDYESNPKLYTPGYQSLLCATGQIRSNESCLIDYTRYPHGFALYGLDLSADGESGSQGTHTSMQRVGNLGITAKFKTAPANAVTFVFYCLWEGCTIEIDKFRNVFVSY